MKIHFQFHFFAIWSISASILSIIAWNAPTSSCSPSGLAMFLRKIPGVLGRLVNFKIPKRFLCEDPCFQTIFFVSFDYAFIHFLLPLIFMMKLIPGVFVFMWQYEFHVVVEFLTKLEVLEASKSDKNC